MRIKQIMVAHTISGDTINDVVLVQIDNNNWYYAPIHILQPLYGADRGFQEALTNNRIHLSLPKALQEQVEVVNQEIANKQEELTRLQSILREYRDE